MSRFTTASGERVVRTVFSTKTPVRPAGTGSAAGVTINAGQAAEGGTEFTISVNAALVVIGDKYHVEVYDPGNTSATPYVLVIDIA